MHFIREINDAFEGSEDIFHKFYRYLLRLSMNLGILGDLSIRILLKTTFFTDINIRILVLKNFFYYNYLRSISLGDFKKAIEFKKKWARLIISNEHLNSNYAIKTAKKYLKFLAVECKEYSFLKINYNIEKTEFYIYGPNSQNYPSPKLASSYLVLTKFPNFDISIFPKKILFLNSFSILNYDKNYLVENTKDFEIVFIPETEELFADNVRHLSCYSDNLAGPMGLGRIMMTLHKLKKNPIIFAEGFDLGLNKEAYSKKIKTFYNLDDSRRFEKKYSIDITMHDPIFNFLLVKHYSKYYKYIGSNEFLNILNMSLKEYLFELNKSRNFSSILKVF